MSLSSVGSPNPYSYLQWPQQPGSVDTGDPPTDPLQSLYQAFTGGNPNDPLISADGSGGGNGSACGCTPFSPDVMSALLSVQGDQGNSRGSRLQSLFGKFDANGDGQISQIRIRNRDRTRRRQGQGRRAVRQARWQRRRIGHPGRAAIGAAEGARRPPPSSSRRRREGRRIARQRSVASSAVGYCDRRRDQPVQHQFRRLDDHDHHLRRWFKDRYDDPGGIGHERIGRRASPSPQGLNLSNFLERLISLQAQLFAPTTDLTA